MQKNVHEPECISKPRLKPDDTDSWTVEVDIIPGRPIVGHAINNYTGDQLCYVDAHEATASPRYTRIGELFARIRDTFHKA